MRAAARARVGCLSNTNAVHWEQMQRNWGLGQLFDVRFLSHEMRLLKPDREIFERVSTVAGCANEQVVFLDDTSVNVEQADARGLPSSRGKRGR